MKIPHCGKLFRPWTANEDKLLGTQTDAALAEQLCLSEIVVGWRRSTLAIKSFADDGDKPWTDHELRLMGTESDAEIARQIGCTQAAVRYKRGKLGIPAIFGLLWRDKELALLGTLRDEKLARRLDRTIKAVQAKRKSHGIPCFKPGKNFGDRRTTKFSARDRTA